MATLSNSWRNHERRALAVILIIIGTPRKGRFSHHVARFVAAELAQREGIETEVIDVLDVPLPSDGAAGDARGGCGNTATRRSAE